MAKSSQATPFHKRKLNARPDTLDFRDRMYTPTLIEVPPQVPLSQFRKTKVPILDQGQEGACTGFGLATVANYLFRNLRTNLQRKTANRSPLRVSPRMLYEMARQYDEWPGANYDGSSARGAMKGWQKHGVCSEKAWPYHLHPPGHLDDARIADAQKRPLGAYFRVNHKDLVAMHTALAEVGILYATAVVHAGWDNVSAGGLIPHDPSKEGGHAFAIVAYDPQGFWIQNSWGPGWGQGGFAKVSYDDWLENGTDVWVARLGVPVQLHSAASAASAFAGRTKGASTTFVELRSHIISVNNDGQLSPTGTFATVIVHAPG